jgi:Fe-S oxidoreductase
MFDPAGILNPGTIVGAGAVESITEHLRVRPEKREVQYPAVETFFDYSDQEGFGGALEMCNGAGVCRKTAGGTMCPSYRATLEERHTTRGRANALRLAISGQLPVEGGGAAWGDNETLETLSLCLSCKACKSECPSNVDMARLKAEYLAQSYRAAGKIPLAARVFGHVRVLNRIGAMAPGLARVGVGLMRPVMNSVLGLAPRRRLPGFGRSLYRWFERRPASVGQRTVVLFGDCFTTYNEPEIGRAAVGVLEKLGYRVVMPRTGCCGRAMISTGLLQDAIAAADSVVERLRGFVEDPAVAGIVVCEPSCLSAMKDEYLTLKLASPIELRKKLAAKAMGLEEFVEAFWESHPAPVKVTDSRGGAVVFHGHCHQKALWGTKASEAVLRRMVGERLKVLPSGCCGMAGSFGYMADKYDVSMKIGELSLFGDLRKLGEDATVVAAGTSCRHQIRDGTGRVAVHPAMLMAPLMGAQETPARPSSF